MEKHSAIEKERGVKIFLPAWYGAAVKWILFGRCS